MLPAAARLLAASAAAASGRRGAAATAAAASASARRLASTTTKPPAAALYLTSPEGGARGATPLLLGLMNYLERHLPDVGYFLPVGSPASERDPLTGLDRRASLVAAASDQRLGDPRDMVCVPEEEAALLIATGRTSELLDRIYASFASRRDRYDVLVVEGTSVGGTEFEAQLAAALGTPVLLALDARRHLGHGHAQQQQQQDVMGLANSAASSSSSSSSSSPSASDHHHHQAADDLYGAAMLRRSLFADHGVDLLGVAVNRAPARDQPLIARQLGRRFADSGVAFAGAIPDDPLLSGVRLGEVKERLGATLLCGDGDGGGGRGGRHHQELLVDREFNAVVVASQRLEDLLAALHEEGGGSAAPSSPAGAGSGGGGNNHNHRPLVVTTADRLDLVLGLLATHLSASAPPIAGVLLCPTATSSASAASSPSGFGAEEGGDSGSRATTNPHAFARRTIERVFEGMARGGYRGALLPVLGVGSPLYDVARALGDMGGSIMENSARKIGQCRTLFDRHIDASGLVARLELLAASSAQTRRVTPKMFQHRLTQAVLRDPQHIVLPEGTDARVLAAAAEATARGLARITLLGDPAAVHAEASKLGVDVSRCSIIDPATSHRAAAYAELYMAIRSERHRQQQQGAAATAVAKPGGRALPPPPTREASLEAVRSDLNLFGVMMVRAGAADGMVSGAAHTTAATVRPAMQVLRRRAPTSAGGEKQQPQQPALPAVATSLISSVFFMCLPDRVLVFGDCAVNVSPTAEELAAIAVCSADTALAFGIEPRVAMLSYSTLGSGAGPEVERVAAATALVKAWRPDLAVEGPIQYDAAVDAAIAKLKIKGASEVAGKATVCIFPSLDSGNVVYKAVQQSSGCVAMGPVLQNLAAPVNDLSRGCTVRDIVSTITITGVQAQQAKRRLREARRREEEEAASAA